MLEKLVDGLPRTFWLLWTGLMVNRMGAFVIPFLAIYLGVGRDFSPAQTGVAIGLHGLSGAAGTMLSGVLADRWGRRPTLLVGQFTAVVPIVGLGLAYDYWTIVGFAVLASFFTGAVWPAYSAMMIDIVPESDRLRSFSLNQWAVTLGSCIAGLGGTVAAQDRHLLVFLVDACATLGTALITYFLLPETLPGKAAAPRTAAVLNRGLGAVFRDRTFIFLAFLNFVLLLVASQNTTTLPIAMTADDNGPAVYGWMIVLNGVLLLGGQLFVPKMIAGRPDAHVLALAAALAGVGFGLNAFADGAWFYALTVVIWTLGEMVHFPATSTTVASLAPVLMRGRYQAVLSLFISAAWAVGPITGGFVQGGLGTAVLWLGCGGLCALVVVGQLAAGPSRERRIEELRLAEAEAPEVPVATGS
ncbi:MFS transporter [Micromonospora ureilytica]|uniref:MDR family MFS transporter n=1 Tax=Micromonospora ureilytica TaxID=709868 RepID=UPI0033CFB455